MAVGLPTEVPDIDPDLILKTMMHDKKVKSGVLRMVLNRGIGQCDIVDVVDPLSVLEPVLHTL